ncbi:MAG: hypothetical protein JXC32_10470 [Anaerolineae bacterium]|nr:hypothetical protein [Anaerolineae bacterium]
MAVAFKLMLLLAMMAGGSTGAVRAARESLPGSPLYAIKTQLENWELGQARNPDALTQVAMAQAQNRVEEARRLADQGDGVPSELAARYQERLGMALQASGTLTEPLRLQVRASISETVRNQMQIMAKVAAGTEDDGEAGPVQAMVQAMVQAHTQIGQSDDGDSPGGNGPGGGICDGPEDCEGNANSYGPGYSGDEDADVGNYGPGSDDDPDDDGEVGSYGPGYGKNDDQDGQYGPGDGSPDDDDQGNGPQFGSDDEEDNGNSYGPGDGTGDGEPDEDGDGYGPGYGTDDDDEDNGAQAGPEDGEGGGEPNGDDNGDNLNGSTH